MPGGSFFKDQNGILVPNAQSDATLSALYWAQSLWQTYSMPQPADGMWDWYKQAWLNGTCGFYIYQAYGGFNNNSEMSGMADPWGAVAFPIGPGGTDYVTIGSSMSSGEHSSSTAPPMSSTMQAEVKTSFLL